MNKYEKAVRTDGGIGVNDHYVRVGGEALDQRDELRVAYEHRAEHCAHFAARDLEVLDDVRDLLEPIRLALEALAARSCDHLRAPPHQHMTLASGQTARTNAS